MIYLTIVIAAVLVFVLQARIYRKYAFDKLEYKVTLSSDEVFEGDVYMCTRKYQTKNSSLSRF